MKNGSLSVRRLGCILSQKLPMERGNLMTDIMISHPRMALTLTEAMKGQIANGPEGRRLQEQIYKAVDDFYKLLDGHGFFCDRDGRRPLGIALVITCDTIGDMDITINDAREWRKDEGL